MKNNPCRDWMGVLEHLSTHSYKTILTEAFKVFYGDMFRPRGPFLESPGNLTGPKSNIQIEI